MKPIKQWLEELPEPYRTQALENLTKQPYNGSNEVDCMKDAVKGAFDWIKSKEGTSYWLDVWYKISKNSLVDKE